MCYFVACAVPEDHRDAVNRALFPSTSKMENASLDRVFDEPVASFWLVDGWCACSLFDGSQSRWLTGDVDAEAEKLRRRCRLPRYRKRGWTDERIEAAVQDLRQRHRQSERNREGLSKLLTRDVRDLAVETGWAALLVHWFSGDVDEEDLAEFPFVRMTGDKLVRESAAFPEDTWVHVVRG